MSGQLRLPLLMSPPKHSGSPCLGCGLSEGLATAISIGPMKRQESGCKEKLFGEHENTLLAKARRSVYLFLPYCIRDFSHVATFSCNDDGKCSLTVHSEKWQLGLVETTIVYHSDDQSLYLTVVLSIVCNKISSNCIVA